MKLKIYVLTDNTASSSCKAEHGLSYLVEFDKKILFDTGQSDLFQENARFLDAPLEETGTIVLSHGHYDHGNGLKFIDNKTLICHPDAFLKRYSGHQMKYVGLNQTEEQIKQRFSVRESREPVWVSDKMIFLGQIPRRFGFEKNITGFYLENKQPDDIPDDTGLAVIMQQGLFVISGCAHSGICNIIEHARDITGIQKVYGVIGGFHLKQYNQQTIETIKKFKEWGIKVVMPSHCTELPALSAFYNEFKGEQVKAGTLYTFDKLF
ncbi:MAG TPA: MBL fold metallo-hydrolase [Marinilabiliales bacterium]|nr:MBL fold metallo-hydrolase [Marinilabiliales bacterium]